MSETKNLTEPEVQSALSETSEAAKASSRRPDWDSLRSEFGNLPSDEGSLVPTENGMTLNDWTSDKKHLRRFHEMTQQARDDQYQAGQNSVAREFPEDERIAVKNRQTGEVEKVPERNDSQASFGRKWTTTRKQWNRFSRPKEDVAVQAPSKIYAASQWTHDCPTCGYPTDRWQRDHIFGSRSPIADDCSRCERSFDLYRRGVA